MHPARVCHVLVYDLADPTPSLCRIKPQSLSDTLFKRHLRCLHVNRQPPLGKAAGLYQSLHNVGIGHGGLCASLCKSCGSWFRACAFRSDLQTAQPIHMRDGAATGTDLDHFDHRDAHRHARPLNEPCCPCDFKLACALRSKMVDQAQFCCGSAHIETEHLTLAGFGGDACSQNSSTGRARFYQSDWQTCGGFHRSHAATSGHHQNWAGQPLIVEAGLKTCQIAGHLWLDISVGDGGRKPVELARLWADLMR